MTAPHHACQNRLRLGTTGMYRPPVPSDARLVAAGAAMRQIRTSKPEMSWLQGPGPTDLFTWVGESGEIKEQELTFFGRSVLARGGSMTTGLCDEGGRGAYQGKTGILSFDTKIDADTLAAAYIVLDAMKPALQPGPVEVLKRKIADALEALGATVRAPQVKDASG
jgi:hypothetical protein